MLPLSLLSYSGWLTTSYKHKNIKQKLTLTLNMNTLLKTFWMNFLIANRDISKLSMLCKISQQCYPIFPFL